MDPLLEDEYLQPRRRRGRDDGSLSDPGSDPGSDSAPQTGRVSFDPYALDDIFGDEASGAAAGPSSGELRDDARSASGSGVSGSGVSGSGVSSSGVSSRSASGRNAGVDGRTAERGEEGSGPIRVRVRAPGTLDEAPRSIRIALEAEDRPPSGRRPRAKDPAGTLPPVEPAPERKKRPEPKAFIPGSAYGAPSEDPEDDDFDFDSTEIDSGFESDLDRRFGEAARRMREKISQREAIVEEDPRRGAKVALGLGCLLLATVGFLLGYRYWVTHRAGGPKQPVPVSGPATPGSSTGASAAGTPPGAQQAELSPLPAADTVEGKIKRALNFGLPVYRAPKEER